MTETKLPVKLNPATIKWNDLESMELNLKGKLVLRTQMLNRTPPKEWVKKYGEYEDLPVDKVEYLLTAFFGSWRVEIKSAFQIANSICVTVRLYYLNPDTEEYDWQDGAGAWPMQVDKGANPMDSSKIKSNSVKLALPAAESEAEKDAADKIGKLFGRDLNRKDTLDYLKLIEGKDFSDAKFKEK